MISFSIVICTYNPELEIFQRLLDAVLQFDIINPSEHEVIIVDNNSSLVLSENVIVKDFLSKKKNARIIRETTAGLTSARIAGIENARNEWIVFFDDDNEPEKDYLINAAITIGLFPQVGAWGPGRVKVELLGDKKINRWLCNNLQLFQASEIDGIEFDNTSEWKIYYPNGTGLIIKKSIAKGYVQGITEGRYSLSDRIGKKLFSGGDTQMIFQAIKMKFYAGTSSLLKLNHLISSKKISMRYILSQVYMTSSCYVKAFNEIGFEGEKIELDFLNNKQIFKIIYSVIKIYAFNKPFKSILVILYSKLGEINARYLAGNENNKPTLLRVFESFVYV